MEKIISELRLRATQERIAARIGRTSKQRTAEAEHAARALENIANDLERQMTPAPVEDRTPTTRTVEWGHNGITFLDGKDIIGQAWFPTGPQGPIDGTIGSPERRHWEDVCAAWRNHALLPNGWTLFAAYGTFYRWSEEAGLEYQSQLADGSMEPIDPEEGPNVPDPYASEAIHKCDAVIIAYLKAPDAPYNANIRAFLANPAAFEGEAGDVLPVVCDECGIRFGDQCEHF